MLRTLLPVIVFFAAAGAAFAAPPANDNCADAQTLIHGVSCTAVNGNTREATRSIDANCVGDPEDDVWYKFIATSPVAEITVEGSDEFDAVVELLSACEGTTLLCKDGSVEGEIEFLKHTALVVGETYYIRVYDYYDVPPLTTGFTICVKTSVPPANDHCADALTLDVSGTCTPILGTTLNATASGSVGCVGDANDDVYYKFIANSNRAEITVDGDSDFDAVVQLLSSCGGTTLACVDRSTNGGIEVITSNNLTIGQTYYIRVFHYNSADPVTPGFTICVKTAPANDNCANAIALVPSQVFNSPDYSTSGATQSLEGCQGTANDDVWFSFEATATKAYIKTVPATGFDPVIEAFSSCGGTSIVCKDDEPVNKSEIAELTNLVIGETYYFRIYDFTNDNTNINETFQVSVLNEKPLPDNHTCDHAVALPVSLTGTCGGEAFYSLNATADMDVCEAGGNASDDVWFKFTAPSSGVMVEAEGSEYYDVVLQVLDGCTGSSLICADEMIYSGAEVAHVQGLTAGQTYYVRVYEYSEGNPVGEQFTVCITNAAITNVPDQDLSDFAFSVNPNPASDKIIFKAATSQPGIVTIFSIEGVALLSYDLQNPSAGLSADISSLERGMYIVKFENELGFTTQKLMKSE